MEKVVNGGVSVTPDQQKPLKQAVCEILGITRDALHEMIYEAGVEYLEHYIPGDDYGIRTMVCSGSYWAWWRMNWESRDRAFVAQNFDGLSFRNRRDIYNGLHDAAVLASSIYPGRVVLDNSYAEMIQRMFDAETPA